VTLNYQCHHRSLALRNDLLPGFDGAVGVFEAWMPLLLLRAAHSLGFFQAPGATTTSAELASTIVPAYRRFTAEMLAMLQRSGASNRPEKSVQHASEEPLNWTINPAPVLRDMSSACARAGAWW
jgi:hypothetical protein